MAKSLSSVRAFFSGLDDGAAQARLAAIEEDRRKKADQDFLLAQSNQDLRLAQEGRNVLEFDSAAAARANKLAADTEAGQFFTDGAGVRRRANDGKIADATTSLDVLDTTRPQRAINTLAEITNSVTATALKNASVERIQALKTQYPLATDAELGALSARLVAGGAVTPEVGATTAGVTLRPGAEKIDPIEQANIIGNPLAAQNKMLTEQKAVMQDTERFNRETAASLEKAEQARIAKDRQNATPAEILQRQGHQAGMAAMRGLTGQAATTAYNNAKANVVGSAAAPTAGVSPTGGTTTAGPRSAPPGLTAPSATAATQAAVVAATVPSAALPTPPAPAPAPVAPPPDPQLVTVERLNAEIAALQKTVSTASPAAFRASTAGKRIQELVAQREQVLRANSAASVSARSQPFNYR